MSVKLINQHVNDGSYFPIFRIHKAMDATPPVAGEWKPADIVHLVAVLFPGTYADLLPLLPSLIQLLQHVVDMYCLFHLS